MNTGAAGRRNPRRARVIAVAAAVCLVIGVLAAGCGRGPRTDTPTVQPSSSIEPIEVARFAVVFAYQQFWVVLPLIDKDPVDRIPGELQAVAEEPELGRQIDAATGRRTRRVHLYGETVPHVIAVSGAEGTDAFVNDCADASHSGTADDRTHQPITVGASRTHLLAHLHRADELGNWKVRELISAATIACDPDS